MRILSRAEVFNAVKHAKSLNEEQGKEILEYFNKHQAGMGQMIFISFPEAIASINTATSHLFMDLCFDIIVVYQEVLGEMPKNIATPHWLQKTMAGLEDEIKQQTAEGADPSVLENSSQTQLLEYLSLAVEEFAGKNKAKKEAAGIMYNLLFLVTRLIDSLYDEAAPKKAA